MPKTAFLFPGQGAQALGMGNALYESVPAAKRLFDEATDVLGYSLIDLCTDGPIEKLNSTVVSQPAIYVASLAALEKLKQDEPSAVSECVASAGLSLGEYTALAFAEVFSFADGLRLVQKRGEAMQAAADATASSMVSVLGLDREKVAALCEQARPEGLIEIANLLGPGNIVVSGTKAACDAVERLAPAAGAMKTIRLTVAGAFHTSIMKPADEKLAAALADVRLLPGRIPVWSNVDGLPHNQPDEIRDLLIKQVLNPVQWEKSMAELLTLGLDRFYEIGPGRVLAGLLKRMSRKTECRNIQA